MFAIVHPGAKGANRYGYFFVCFSWTQFADFWTASCEA
jgi:hypothetical protein